MRDSYELAGTRRERVGKGAARALRREAMLPAVIYGDKKDPIPLALPYKETFQLIHGGGFMTTVGTITIDGEKHQVIARDYQLDPVRDFPMHVDFLRVSKGATLTVNIPVHFENEETCPGLKVGGVLNVVRHEVELTCPANAIPESLVLDLANAELGDTLNISDINLPDGAEPTITDRDFTIATIASPAGLKSEEEEETDEEEADISEGRIGSHKVLLAKPTTFMNLSGQAGGEIARFYKLETDAISVIHDELDLEPGRTRIKRGGGHGGHNGLKSLDAHLGKEYRRLRFGIGHPGHRDLVSGYVLKDFPKADQPWVEALCDEVARSIELALDGKDSDLNARLNEATAQWRADPSKDKQSQGKKAKTAASPSAVNDGKAQPSLVRGAASGEGLGNQFLANIREVDAIVHVVRCFEDDDITHVDGKIDPLADIDTIETELMLSDLESLEKRVVAARKKATGKDKDALAQVPLMEKALALLQDGKPARLADIGKDEQRAFNALNLLTSKPILYVCNVEEDSADKGNAFSDKVAAFAAETGARAVVISAAIEAEVAVLDPEEQKDFLETLGLEEPGLDRVIREGYALLGLVTYFTAGPKETRAWTITTGTKAPQAAGVIHTDFERGFIRAQTIAYNDYVTLKGETAAKEAGKARDEGKDYVVQDGDVLLFKFNT
eukprot:g17540.t1